MKLKNLIIALGCAGMVTSCIDENFDLSSVDMKLEFGSDSTTLMLPNCSIDSLLFRNAMDLRKDDDVKIVWSQSEQDSVFCLSSQGTDHMTLIYVEGEDGLRIVGADDAPVNFCDMPNCFQGDSIHLDMYNPALLLTMDNGLRADLNVQMEFQSWKDGQIRQTQALPQQLLARAEAGTRYCVSQIEESDLPEKFRTDEVTWVQYDVNPLLSVTVDRGNGPVDVVPDSIVLKPKNITPATEPTAKYIKDKLDITYESYALFRFGPEFCVHYRDSLTNWHKDLEDIDQIDGKELVGTGTVVNGFPLSLNLRLIPFDTEGHDIDGLVVSSPHAEANASTPITFTITARDGGTLNRYFHEESGYQQLDGIRLDLRLGSDGLSTPRPLHSDASLYMKDVRIGVRGGIIVDAN